MNASLVLSLEIAGLACIVATILGTAIALLLSWKRLPLPELVDAIFSAPLVLPPTVLGYYLLVALGKDSAIGRAWEWLFGDSIVFTFTGAVIAAAVGSVPLVVRSVKLGIDAIDPNLINAARTLGAGRVRVYATVVFWLALPSMAAGAMLAFARALGDYGITMMVAGSRIDGTPPASIYVMDALYAGREADASRMALWTTLVGVALLFAANRLMRKLHVHA